MFEIIVVNDGSRDATGAIADELAAANPGVVRAVHHPTNLGYGAALLSGFRAAGHELVTFTDGDRQFRVADLGRLTARLGEADQPDAVVGYRIKRADPLIRTIYARLYRFAIRVFFGLKVRDVDCACKLFRRDALAGIAVESGGAFFSAELLIKLNARRPVDRRGRRAPPPADGRLADRGEAQRDLPRRARFLVAPAADLVEPGPGAPPRNPGRQRGLGLAPPPLLAGAGIDVERVHEVAEHVEPRVDNLLAGRLERDPAGRLLVALADRPVRAERRLVEHRLRGEDPAAGPHRESQRVRRPRVDLDDPAVELDQEPGVERLLGERGDDHPVHARPQRPRARPRTGRG